MKRLGHVLLAILFPSLLLTPFAVGDTISFFNTGVAADGSVLAPGAIDPHYTLIYASDGGAYTATATPTNGNWVTPDASASWISLGANGGQSADSGYYVYETTLNLTGYDPATAVLSGMIAADDGVSIYLNRTGSAVYTGTTWYGFSSLTPFLINSGFVNGINEIDFVVTNEGGPTGLLVDDTMATAETPEPGSFLLLGTGMAMGAFLILRRGMARTRGEVAGG